MGSQIDMCGSLETVYVHELYIIERNKEVVYWSKDGEE